MRVALVGQKWLGAEIFNLCRNRGDDVAVAAAPAADDRLYLAALAAGGPATVARGRVTGADIPAGCDLIVAAHAHLYIGADARAKTRLGAIGYHPSLLPRHRGRDAVRWAVHMREPITGGTVYWMDDGADSGPVAAQAWCHIRPGDTPAELWRRSLAPLGVSLIARVLDDLDAGIETREEQDPALATWEPAFSPKALSAAE